VDASNSNKVIFQELTMKTFLESASCGRRPQPLELYDAVSSTDLRWRVVMLRLLTIFSFFLVAGANPVQAQHQEAVLQRVPIPGAGIDLVLATPNSENIIYGLEETPDALVIRLHGGALILAFENVESMVQALEHLKKPIYSSWIMKRTLSPAYPSRYSLVPSAE
jgi:hypothetical protein